MVLEHSMQESMHAVRPRISYDALVEGVQRVCEASAGEATRFDSKPNRFGNISSPCFREHRWWSAGHSRSRYPLPKRFYLSGCNIKRNLPPGVQLTVKGLTSLQRALRQYSLNARRSGGKPMIESKPRSVPELLNVTPRAGLNCPAPITTLREGHFQGRYGNHGTAFPLLPPLRLRIVRTGWMLLLHGRTGQVTACSTSGCMEGPRLGRSYQNMRRRTLIRPPSWSPRVSAIYGRRKICVYRSRGVTSTQAVSMRSLPHRGAGLGLSPITTTFVTIGQRHIPHLFDLIGRAGHEACPHFRGSHAQGDA